MREMLTANTTGGPPLLTVAEVAAALRLSPSAIYRAIERGNLGAVRVAALGSLRIPAGELERVLAGEDVSAGPPGSRALGGSGAPTPKEDTQP